MRIVGMSYLDPCTRAFYSALGKEVCVHAVLQVTAALPEDREPSSWKGRWTRLRRSPVRVLRRQTDRVLRWFGTPLLQRLAPEDTCLEENTDEFEIPCISVPQHLVNAARTAELLEELAPDVLITNGAPLLKFPIFSVPRFGAVNVHYGVAPHYRGEDTLFWALYRKDFDKVGITIHRIDQGVDTGTILARAYPDLKPDDSERTLLYRSSLLAAQALPPILSTLDKEGFHGRIQERGGRLYRREDRAIWHEAIYLFRRQALGEQLPHRPQRIISEISQTSLPTPPKRTPMA